MSDSFFREVPRVAVPIGLGGQGPLVAAGIDAVRISGSGELDPLNSDQLNGQRYEKLGRSVIRLFTALNDGGKPDHGPFDLPCCWGRSICPAGRSRCWRWRCCSRPIVASIDAFARARRQREPVGCGSAGSPSRSSRSSSDGWSPRGRPWSA